MDKVNYREHSVADNTFNNNAKDFNSISFLSNDTINLG